MLISNWQECNENNSYYIPPVWAPFLTPALFRTYFEDKMISVILPTIALVGITLNVVFLAIVVFEKSMRTVTNVYLTNLAVSDLLYLLVQTLVSFITYFKTNMKTNYILFGPASCIVTLGLFHLTFHFSLFVVSLLNFERYLAVCHPLLHRRITSISRTKKMMFGCWGMAFAFTFCMMLFKGYTVKSCLSMLDENGNLFIFFDASCSRLHVASTRNGLLAGRAMKVLPFLICLAGKVIKTKDKLC